MINTSKKIMNYVVEHSGRFVSHCFDTIVALITTDAVAADSMTTASISSLEFHVSGPRTRQVKEDNDKRMRTSHTAHGK